MAPAEEVREVIKRLAENGTLARLQQDALARLRQHVSLVPRATLQGEVLAKAPTQRR